MDWKGGKRSIRRFLPCSREREMDGLNYVIAVEIEKKMDLRYILGEQSTALMTGSIWEDQGERS